MTGLDFPSIPCPAVQCISVALMVGPVVAIMILLQLLVIGVTVAKSDPDDILKHVVKGKKYEDTNGCIGM